MFRSAKSTLDYTVTSIAELQRERWLTCLSHFRCVLCAVWRYKPILTPSSGKTVRHFKDRLAKISCTDVPKFKSQWQDVRVSALGGCHQSWSHSAVLHLAQTRAVFAGQPPRKSHMCTRSIHYNCVENIPENICAQKSFTRSPHCC